MIYFPTWLIIAVVIFILIQFLPLLPNERLRYYTCYVQYVVTVSAIVPFLIPFFLLRPKDPINLVFSGNVLKHLSKILGIEWDIRGGEILTKDENRGSVLTLNHQTIFDIMGLFHLWKYMGRTTVIAKQELLYIPPFGPAAWLAGLIYINRKDPKSANIKILEASKYLFKEKINLCVFPEGTRSRFKEGLLPFKNGAFKVALESRASVIPIVLSPYYFIDSKNKLMKKGKVIISVLDPIRTKGMKAEDITVLKERTYKIMSEEYKKLADELKRSSSTH